MPRRSAYFGDEPACLGRIEGRESSAHRPSQTEKASTMTAGGPNGVASELTLLLDRCGTELLHAVPLRAASVDADSPQKFWVLRRRAFDLIAQPRILRRWPDRLLVL